LASLGGTTRRNSSHSSSGASRSTKSAIRRSTTHQYQKKRRLKWTEEVDFKVPVGAFLGSYKIFVAVDRPRAVVGVVLESATGVGNEDDALA
jgi:hypothetical protein